MKTPEDELYIRRQYQRYPCDLPIKVITNHREFNGIAINIGLGGVLIIADNEQPPMELDTIVTIIFNLPSMPAETEVRSNVRWHNKNAIGLQFIELRAKDIWGLRQFIENNDRLNFIKTVITNNNQDLASAEPEI